MIKLTASVESVSQGQALIETSGIDTVYMGSKQLSRQLSHTYSQVELSELTAFARGFGKKVSVAVNGKIDEKDGQELLAYLLYLKDIKVDCITVSDPYIVQLIVEKDLELPYVYERQTLLKDPAHIHVTVENGAELLPCGQAITREKHEEIIIQTTMPQDVIVYRPKSNTLASEEINLICDLPQLVQMGLNNWKLDGCSTVGDNFLAIVELFVIAKEAIEAEQCDRQLLELLNTKIKYFQPVE